MLFRVSDSQKPLALLQNAAATATEKAEKEEDSGRNNNDFVHWEKSTRKKKNIYKKEIYTDSKMK